MGDDCRLLLQTFDEYLAGFLERVGKDRAYSSYDNYRKRRNRLASFLEYEYRVKDIPFKELKLISSKSLWSTSPRYKGCVPGRSILRSRN